MKTAIYIENGSFQVVLTPENEFEKNILKSFGDKSLNIEVFQGQFYDNRGGWIRQKDYEESPYYNRVKPPDDSLIVRARPFLEKE